MNTQLDPRILELEALARADGFELPYPSDFIIWLEDHDKIVNLLTGEVWDTVTVVPAPCATAVAYLLAEFEGEMAF